jgi:hypothetical protein
VKEIPIDTYTLNNETLKLNTNLNEGKIFKISQRVTRVY